MATIKAGCSKCGKSFGVLEHQLGTEVNCPHCQARMKIPKPQRPATAASDALSALDAAAAQLGGPAKPKTQPKPQPSGDGLADLLAATQAKPAAKPKPVAAPPAPVRKTVHNPPGRPDLAHLSPSATAGLMRKPAVVYTVLGAFVLIIGVIVYCIFVNNSQDAGVTGDGQKTQANVPMPVSSAAVSSSPVISSSTALSTSSDNSAVAAAPQTAPEARVPVPASAHVGPPLTLDMNQDNSEDYFAHKGQLVRFATVQNTTKELVPRAALMVSVSDSQKLLLEKTFTFCDVQPGQKMPVIIAFPYEDEKLRYEVKWRRWTTGKPVYKFAARILNVRGTGDYAGTAMVEVRNDTDLAAPLVDLFVILREVKTMEHKGYVTGVIKDLKPREIRNVPIPWDGFESDTITGGEVYAQIDGAE